VAGLRVQEAGSHFDVKEPLSYHPATYSDCFVPSVPILSNNDRYLLSEHEPHLTPITQKFEAAHARMFRLSVLRCIVSSGRR
jgi:hypothetical protein